jgi:hypothetical protein
MIRASDWRPMGRNTLVGFVTLELQPSGLVLNDCSFHRHHDGKEWVGLPAKPQLDRDGGHRKDAHTGKVLYTPVVEIKGKEARERFQEHAVAAVHALLDTQRRAA